MNQSAPVMYVFAGNNGSGKSTIRNLVVDKLGISVNIDPDALARNFDPDYPERRKVSAGKEAIRLARECINYKRSFSIETTLAGGNVIRLMQAARKMGFQITMFYIGLGDYRLNIERVAARVRNGGHDIPTEDIIRRHSTSIQNLLGNIQLLDHLTVIDNSDASGEFVLQYENMVIKYIYEPLPMWVQRIKEELENMNK